MWSKMRFAVVGLGVLTIGALPASSDGIARAADAPAAINVPGVEPFQPPPLAEIEAQAGWIDLPVLDGLKLLREKQAAETPPVTVPEALALQNDSDEANRKILGTLGRLPASDGDVNWEGMITRHQMFDVKSTNPLMASSTEEFDMGTLMGINFFNFDWNLKPYAEAMFVKSWQSSADGMIYKVVMRDDMTWSDGKPVTAYDVQYTFETIMNPKIQIPAVRSGPDKIRAVVAYDAHTVLYFHKEKLASSIWNVNFSLIPKHIYEKTIPNDFTLANSPEHVELQDKPVVGGMYSLVRRARNQELVFERRESFYMHEGKQVRDKPYFKTVRFSLIQEPNTALLALKKGDVDEMLLQPEFWVTQTTTPDFYERCTKARGVEWVYFFFNWNLKTPHFSDVKVRQAMAYTMDYREMLDKLCYGLFEPCSGIFHPTAWMYPQGQVQPYAQDLDKAEDLLDEAGWGDSDGDGIRDKEIDGKLVKFEFTLMTSPTPVAVNICTLMKENLEKIGIICNVQRVERTVMQQKMLDHEFEGAISGWGTGADPSTIDNIWKTGQQRNFGHYSNPEVDKLLDDAEKEPDRAKQAELYGKIHTLIYNDQPYTFLYYRSSFYGFNKGLRGYVFSPRGPYHYGPGFSSIWRAAAH